MIHSQRVDTGRDLGIILSRWVCQARLTMSLVNRRHVDMTCAEYEMKGRWCQAYLDGSSWGQSAELITQTKHCRQTFTVVVQVLQAASV